MIITISGLGGSGKSTIGKRLAKELGYKHYSSGDFQRELAKERGLTIVEWGEKQKEDPKYDKMVDDRMIKIGKENDNIIIDGWLAAHFIPQATKIFLTGDLKIRAARVTQDREAESYDDVEIAMEKTKNREEANRERWLNFYGFDYTDEKNYDLVVDTSHLSIDEVYEKVFKFVTTNK